MRSGPGAVGRVGRPHGRDGSFYIEGCESAPAEGATLVVAGRERRVERRAGEDRRPIVRLGGVEDRESAAALRGEAIRTAEEDAEPGEGEWLVADLVGCRIEGLGEVQRVVSAPSCDLLEVGPDAFLVPLVADAVRRIDVAARRIEVDRSFLGLDPPPTSSGGSAAG